MNKLVKQFIPCAYGVRRGGRIRFLAVASPGARRPAVLEEQAFDWSRLPKWYRGMPPVKLQPGDVPESPAGGRFGGEL